MNDNNAILASFLMKKNSPGHLNEVTFRGFHFSLVDPNSRCFALDSPTGGAGRRVCDDFYDMNGLHAEERMMLICSYVGETGYAVGSGGSMPQHIYWYRERPEIAEPANLFSRSQSHPMLRIEDPRTDCPATIGEVNEIAARRSEKLMDLARQVPEVPSNVVIPRPEAQQRRLDEQQAKHDATYKRIQEAKAALADFPLEGRYEFEMIVDENALAGNCTITKEPMNPLQFAVACLDSNGNHLRGLGTKAGGYFQVMWPDVTLNYAVDLDYREDGGGDALVGNAVNKSGEGRLVRSGDLEAGMAADQSAREMPSTQGARQQAADKQQLEKISPQEARRVAWEERQEELRKQREEILQKRAKIREEREAQAKARRAGSGGQLARLEPPTGEQAHGEPPLARAAPAVCTVEFIAGTYKSALGPIECRPGGEGLECCYGGSCSKRLHLTFDANRRRLVGIWEYASGVKGPVEFDVTETCDLTNGRWGYDATRAPSSAWPVAGRAAAVTRPVAPDASRPSALSDQERDEVARKLASHAGMDAVVHDQTVCRDPLPLTIRAATASALTERQDEVERLIGGIRAILGFECSGKTVPQSLLSPARLKAGLLSVGRRTHPA